METVHGQAQGQRGPRSDRRDPCGPWWRLEPKAKTGHVWGTLYCGRGDRAGCKIWIHSTPQVPGSHARKLLREAMSCPHKGDT